jgi:hypothetical protein
MMLMSNYGTDDEITTLKMSQRDKRRSIAGNKIFVAAAQRT